MSTKPKDSKVAAAEDISGKPTLDGRRIRLADLQSQGTRSQPTTGDLHSQHWLKRVWAACNDFLAGMYTGESCAGTPHSERKSAHGEEAENVNQAGVYDQTERESKKDS